MTSTERLRAVESIPLNTPTIFQCFAAQDTSLERSVVAKAESGRTNVLPFHMWFHWSRDVKGMFATQRRPLKHVTRSLSVSSHDATVPNHRVERSQSQTIASWRKRMRLTTWSCHGIILNILTCSHTLIGISFRKQAVCTDSWDFHGKTIPNMIASIVDARFALHGSPKVGASAPFFTTSKVRFCSDVFCPVPKHKTCAVSGDFKS